MITVPVRATALLAVAIAASAYSQVEQQTSIEVLIAERILAAYVTADNDEFPNCTVFPSECPRTHTAVGILNDAANRAGGGKHGSSGSAEAQQATNIESRRARSVVQARRPVRSHSAAAKMPRSMQLRTPASL